VGNGTSVEGKQTANHDDRLFRTVSAGLRRTHLFVRPSVGTYQRRSSDGRLGGKKRVHDPNGEPHHRTEQDRRVEAGTRPRWRVRENRAQSGDKIPSAQGMRGGANRNDHGYVTGVKPYARLD